MRLLSDLLSLFYPQLCVACGQDLYFHENCLCDKCKAHLPKTYYYKMASNPITQLFEGRLPLEHACAAYTFDKGGSLQTVLHQLKYKNRPDIGIALGRLFGTALRHQEPYNTIDAIVPVPLHPKKERQRGYNQSAKIGIGLAERMQCDLFPHALKRVVFTASQTHKSKEERWANVQGKFSLSQAQKVSNKHILLIDDVLTTGATLEACAHTLLRAPIRLSIACIAVANK